MLHIILTPQMTVQTIRRLSAVVSSEICSKAEQVRDYKLMSFVSSSLWRFRCSNPSLQAFILRLLAHKVTPTYIEDIMLSWTIISLSMVAAKISIGHISHGVSTPVWWPPQPHRVSELHRSLGVTDPQWSSPEAKQVWLRRHTLPHTDATAPGSRPPPGCCCRRSHLRW